MSERTWHHYFHGEGINMSKVHEDAATYMVDYKYPHSSIVHDHPIGVPCEDKHHTAYDQLTRQALPFLYNDEAQRMIDEYCELLNRNVKVENDVPMGNGLRRTA